MWAGRRRPWRRQAAFSLVELLISLGLIMMLTLALLTSYVFILRGDQSVTNYGSMNAQARQMLEVLGNDLRTAVDVTDFTASSLTLSVPTTAAGGTNHDVVWEYDSNTATLTRQDASLTKIYARDVQTLSFYYTNATNVQTASLVEVKQVQISLRMLRLVASSVTSQYVISAQFTMRAKSTAH